MKKKQIRLYNALFPVWMLLSMPYSWFVVIPGNFLIDSLVLILAMKVLKLDNRKEFYKEHIGSVFILGFLADILAAIPMWCCAFLNSDLLVALGGNFGDGPLLTVPGVVLAGVLIYVFNYFITFRKQEKPLRKKLSLTLAIATAPYTFLIPSAWVYGF